MLPGNGFDFQIVDMCAGWGFKSFLTPPTRSTGWDDNGNNALVACLRGCLGAYCYFS